MFLRGNYNRRRRGSFSFAPALDNAVIIGSGSNSDGSTTVGLYAVTVTNFNEGFTNWVNPTNAQGAPTSSYATATAITFATPSNLLLGYNYGFAILGGVTINYLRFTIQVQQTITANNGLSDWIVQLDVNGSLGSTNVATGAMLPTTLGTVTYQGNSTYWGQTLTPANINNSGSFGIAWGVRGHTAGDAGNAIANGMLIEVNYK